MNLTKDDFSVMRNSLITFALAIVFSLSLIIWSTRQAEFNNQDWRDAQRQLHSAQSELLQARQAQNDINNYLSEYTAAFNQHLIGTEARLEWLESLEELRPQKLVEKFRYTLAAQKNYVPPTTPSSDHVSIHYSEMKLQLDLLHEAQLFDFLDAVREKIKGWYQLESCTLLRMPDDAKNTGLQLKAECSGGWITLQNQNTQP